MTSSNLRVITTLKGLFFTVALSLFMAAFVFASSSSAASQYVPAKAPVAQVSATAGDPSPPVDPVPSQTGAAQVSVTVPAATGTVPAATGTVPVATGTVAATGTVPVATGTVAGSTAVATGTVGGGTAVATGTVAGSTAVATGTTAATSPTAEATMGVAATATTDLGGGGVGGGAAASPTTDLSGGGAVGGATGGGTTAPGMPATGNGDNWLVLLLVALGALSLAAGLLVRVPQKKQ